MFLDRAKKFLFTCAGVAALARPLGIAIVLALAIRAQAPLAFEVASVKPHESPRNDFGFGTASRESPILISGNRVTMSGLLRAWR
jgi:hypothetical protein